MADLTLTDEQMAALRRVLCWYEDCHPNPGADSNGWPVACVADIVAAIPPQPEPEATSWDDEVVEAVLNSFYRLSSSAWSTFWTSEAVKRLEALRTEGYEVVERVELENLRLDDVAVAELEAEIERLRGWKESAMSVMAEWDAVFEALGRPGPLGGSKATSALAEVERLRAESGGGDAEKDRK